MRGAADRSPDDEFRSQFEENLDLVQEVVRFVCRRRGFRGQEAEDFRSHVHLRLVESDFAVFRKFQGRCKLRTYLITVVSRMGLDFLIAKIGKWRPSAQAQRMGPVAVRLEELLYREGHTLQEAGEILRTSERLELPAGTLEEIAESLPVRAPRRFVGEEKLQSLADGGQPPDRRLESEQQAAERQAASRLLREALAELDREDRLLVRLRFEKGLQVATIARTLDLRQKPLYGRLERVLRDLRRRLEARGLSTDQVGEMFRDRES